jgi:hypothetical protein
MPSGTRSLQSAGIRQKELSGCRLGVVLRSSIEEALHHDEVD